MHNDVIKWKHFPRYWPFVWGIHRPPLNSPHKSQWREALVFSFICAWINGWVNNREAGDLIRPRAHYDVIAMWKRFYINSHWWGKSTGHRRFSITKGQWRYELWCFDCCRPEQAVQWTATGPVIGDTMTIVWSYCEILKIQLNDAW